MKIVICIIKFKFKEFFKRIYSCILWIGGFNAPYGRENVKSEKPQKCSLHEFCYVFLSLPQNGLASSFSLICRVPILCQYYILATVFLVFKGAVF